MAYGITFQNAIGLIDRFVHHIVLLAAWDFELCTVTYNQRSRAVHQ